MTKTRYAILYTRWSPRPNAAECESTQTQLERLRDWCRALGLHILDEFSDEDMSGSRADNRPALQDAIYQACKNRAVLCVYSLSRLARNTKDAIEIAERLDKSRADLASLHERIDTGTAMGRFFFVVMAALAALEREQIVERTSDAMKRHQANGRRMGRADRCPFGKRPSADNPDALEDHPEEVAVSAQIIALAAAGETSRAICRKLDRDGVARRGKTWDGAHRLVGLIIARGCAHPEAPPAIAVSSTE